MRTYTPTNGARTLKITYIIYLFFNIFNHFSIKANLKNALCQNYYCMPVRRRENNGVATITISPETAKILKVATICPSTP